MKLQVNCYIKLKIFISTTSPLSSCTLHTIKKRTLNYLINLHNGRCWTQVWPKLLRSTENSRPTPPCVSWILGPGPQWERLSWTFLSTGWPHTFRAGHDDSRQNSSSKWKIWRVSCPLEEQWDRHFCRFDSDIYWQMKVSYCLCSEINMI